jgi:translation initiation factor IF-2
MLFVVLAIRDVALNVGRTLALGHTLDRMLRSGSFKNDDSVATRRHEAERLRKAFDEAFRGVDERVVRRAMAALRQQVGRAAGGLVGVVEVASDAEVAAFLVELDRRVDLALLGHPLG